MVLTRSDKSRATRRNIDATGVPQGEPPSLSSHAVPPAPRTDSREMRVPQGAPPPPSSHTVPAAPRIEAPSTPGAPQDPTPGPSSRPATFDAFSPASPTGPDRGVRPRPSRLATAASSTPATATTVMSGIVDPITTATASSRDPAPVPPRRDGYPPSTSRRSSRASQRLLELARAKEEHIRAKEKQAQLQVELAAARIATIEAESQYDEDEDARTTITEEDVVTAQQSQRIDTWLHQVTLPEEEHRQLTAPPLMPPSSCAIPAATAAQLKPSGALPITGGPAERAIIREAPKSDIAQLAEAIMMSSQLSRAAAPSRSFHELPFYGGAHQEWLSFKAAYNESVAQYTATENTARLRRCLKGRARESVENLLLHPTDPAEVMATLERRFGRPDAIATTEIARLRALPKLTDSPREICIFANQVANVVAALKALDRVTYVHNPEVTSAVSEKLPPILRHRWFEFAAAQPSEEPSLIKLSRFLKREADLCSPYAQPEPDDRPTPRQDNRQRRQERAYTAQTKEGACAMCRHLEEIKTRLPSGTARPKILIGQDNWPLLLASDTRQGRRDQPAASLTPLGWVLHGTCTRALGHRVHFVAHLAEATPDDRMDEELRKYFAIEGLTVAPKNPQSDPDQRALKILETATRQLPDSRYETALLWKEDEPKMPNNYDMALNRLKSVERKLKRDPVVAEKYRQQMKALVEKGYAEVAPTAHRHNRTWYLPHFGVTTPMKPDKLRIVHDAAAKTQGRSLNDYLLTGPDQLQSLPGVLMRFRQHAVAVSADIAEMFMQISIRSEDRDALRYLWRENTETPPTEYRMKSVIFGATSSPATAIFVKNKNAEKHRHEYPEAADAIVHNHYMDDYLGSYRTPQDAIRIALQVRRIHKQAHFELRKWNSNASEVRQHLTEDEPPADVTLNTGGSSERVLGLIWKPDPDDLGFNLDMARIPTDVLRSYAPTKRQALRIVMSIYDPLGLVSVVTNAGRQILQELWRRGTAWDANIDEDLAVRWHAWMENLQQLRNISIPRPYSGYSDATCLQLHTFVGASEAAYAAALYWRAVMPDGEVRTSLVLGKARVAPLKLSTIPRLELQAAVMGSRMAAAVTAEHDRKPDARFFWTDSMTALTWLRTGSRSYRPFVAHRIATVEENSSLTEWRWIPTKLNVADDATRDVPVDFDSQHRWFTGPEFLRAPEETWPAQPTALHNETTGEERCHATTTSHPCVTKALPDPTRFSKWERYLRTAARVIQFVDLCRPRCERTYYKRTRANPLRDPTWQRNKKRPSKTTQRAETRHEPATRLREIDGDVLRRAEKLIWRSSQENAFAEEISDLREGRAVAINSRLRSLSLIYQDGLIILNSRIQAASGVPEELKSPPVLDGNRHEVRLLIDFTHRRAHHSGVEATISECRQLYWILRLRPTTKMVVHRCLPCRARRDTPPKPATGDHPACRLAHHQRPFTFVGVDYFGPQSVAVGRTIQKRYVAIFSCLTTRAIHLEPTMTLSADSAVMALRRMIARRGTPTEIWSDNGSNLRGADRALRQAIDRDLEAEASKKSISWRFIAPGAPFMGGAWERMVRAVKTALAATQQRRHPTDEVFNTLLTEAEFTVNNRPLTHVSVSPEDPEPLTPNHFLLGGPARVPTPGTFTDQDLIGRTHWRASQRLADLFWERWVREYLPDLQYRREPHSRGPPVQTGDVVIIADNTLPRNTWPRGVVDTVYPGPDGVTRVVDVRTAGGILRRPVKKLVILPVTHRE